MRMTCAIFDMDGTLLDTMWKWDQIGEETLRRFGRTPRPDFWDTVTPMGAKATAEYCIRAYDLPCTVTEFIQAEETAMMAFYTAEAKAKAGVEKVLMLLKMEGVEMYLATATSRPLVEAALKTTGLGRFFKGIITCEEVGSGKAESAKVYEYAMKRMSGNKLGTVIFEDSWAAIQTAKEAGFRVAAVYDDSSAAHWEEMKALADYAYESFDELMETREIK